MPLGKLASVFELANQLGRTDSAVVDRYDLRLYSPNGGPIRSSSGVRIWTDTPRLDGTALHATFILGGDQKETRLDETLNVWLRQALPRDRREAPATSRMCASESEGRQRLGAPCGMHGNEKESVLEAALAIVIQDVGCEIARKIVACLTSPACRGMTGGQFEAREMRASQLIRNAVHHLRANSANRISVADVAQAVAMSERNFLRRFKNEIGVTPTEFILRVRLENACGMLLQTDLPADKVARRTGLGSGDRLAKLFRQHLSISPTEYRTSARRKPATERCGA
ncbi:AraC family transcriptional regulator [Bordetella ansorpii]|uniref:AraC family transcriptional regulator n=1 Tax=Bordetella ansorpii TaxID=288768 RepID=A0A157QZI8_9BORD|nr:helix-turn-helix domain-containing protein [Bordetella ansorpii]SAI51117.1 AraC family transcriptional regulator [Bordetella ansorpii]